MTTCLCPGCLNNEKLRQALSVVRFSLVNLYRISTAREASTEDYAKALGEAQQGIALAEAALLSTAVKPGDV